jgi:hypothetical protein
MPRSARRSLKKGAVPRPEKEFIYQYSIPTGKDWEEAAGADLASQAYMPGASSKHRLMFFQKRMQQAHIISMSHN